MFTKGYIYLEQYDNLQLFDNKGQSAMDEGILSEESISSMEDLRPAPREAEIKKNGLTE